jgi:hypothetical protein
LAIIPDLNGDKLFVNLAELHRLDVFSTRAFLPPTFSVAANSKSPRCDPFRIFTAAAGRLPLEMGIWETDSNW